MSKRSEKDDRKSQERKQTSRGGNVAELTTTMVTRRGSRKHDTCTESAGRGCGFGQTAVPANMPCTTPKAKHHSEAEPASDSRGTKRASKNGRKASDVETGVPDARPKIKQGKEPCDVKITKATCMLQGGYSARTPDEIGMIAVRPKVKTEKREVMSLSIQREFVVFEHKRHDALDKERRGCVSQSVSAECRSRKTEIKTSESGGDQYFPVAGSDVSYNRKLVCNPNGLSKRVSLHFDQVVIITMNASGPGTADKLKEGITYTITTNKPKLVLFQEFTWKGISGKVWKKYPLPSCYQYFGNKDASILFDTRHIVAEELSSTEMRRILEKLQGSSNNYLKKPFPMDFDPLARMCISLVTTKSVPFPKFICVSWHGPYIRCTLDRRKDYFSYLLEFLRNIMLKFESPLLLAGDFNIDFHDIEALITHPFKKCPYKPSDRRKGSVIDYFIITDNLELSDIRFLDIGDHESSFDHDPLMSSLNVLNMRSQAKLL